jgi:hypothetical protein
MTWYVATVVHTTRLVCEDQKTWPVELQSYLIEAASDNEAFKVADEFGKSDSIANSEGLTWNDKPARQEYLGIIRLNLIYPPITSKNGIGEGAPENGSELTHFYGEVGSFDEALALANGRPAVLNLCSQSDD